MPGSVEQGGRVEISIEGDHPSTKVITSTGGSTANETRIVMVFRQKQSICLLTVLSKLVADEGVVGQSKAQKPKPEDIPVSTLTIIEWTRMAEAPDTRTGSDQSSIQDEAASVDNRVYDSHSKSHATGARMLNRCNLIVVTPIHSGHRSSV